MKSLRLFSPCFTELLLFFSPLVVPRECVIRHAHGFTLLFCVEHGISSIVFARLCPCSIMSLDPVRSSCRIDHLVQRFLVFQHGTATPIVVLSELVVTIFDLSPNVLQSTVHPMGHFIRVYKRLSNDIYGSLDRLVYISTGICVSYYLFCLFTF